jgi:hypothetical protein
MAWSLDACASDRIMASRRELPCVATRKYDPTYHHNRELTVDSHLVAQEGLSDVTHEGLAEP